jgi:2-oxoacid:acceptor oxidoreductase delta subunit (pyruvate/2-ketoisovalerate family)
MMTGCPGVFAGGDMVPAERTVTVAAGHGKRAARHIDAWLAQLPGAVGAGGGAGRPVRGSGSATDAHQPAAGPAAASALDANAPRHELAGFQMLNTWYFADAPATEAPRLDAIRRQSSFDEVQQGLDQDNALFEARRCLSCGNCFECDNCYAVCPDNAVIKLASGERYAIDYDYCKGCGLCAEECPCGAIAMEPEPS